MRESQYNFYFEHNNHVVVFNSLSQKYVIVKNTSIEGARQMLSGQIKNSDLDIQKLENANILTSLSKYDEQLLCDSQYYQGINNNTLQITLVTTLECNFDCVYCAQNHTNVYMEEETYDRVYQLILRNIRNFNSLKLILFGGEPTLALNRFEPFLKKVNALLSYYKKQFVGVMITNGFLLSETVVRKLYQLNITQFQVTLDASPYFHNRTRLLKGGQQTYERVYNNLKHICELKELTKISVVILINSTYEMLLDLDLWAGNYDTFINDSRFSITLGVVENRGGTRINDFQDTLITEAHPLYQRAVCILSRHIFANNKIKGNAFVCESLRQQCYTVDWDGKLRACSQLTRQNIIGELKKGGHTLITTTNAGFRLKNHPTCHGCTVEPLCHGKSCGYKLICKKQEITQLITNFINSQLNTTPGLIEKHNVILTEKSD